MQQKYLEQTRWELKETVSVKEMVSGGEVSGIDFLLMQKN